MHVLIDDEKRRACDWQSEQCGNERDAGPVRGWFHKAPATEAKASEQHEKNAGQMPEKRDPGKGGMRCAHDSCDGLMKQSDANIEEKKIGVERIKLRMDQFLDGGHVHRHVFDAVVITADQHRCHGKHRKPEEILCALSRWGADDRVSRWSN